MVQRLPFLSDQQKNSSCNNRMPSCFPKGDHCTSGHERMPPAAKGLRPLESRHESSPLQCNSSALTGCQVIGQQSQKGYDKLQSFLHDCEHVAAIYQDSIFTAVTSSMVTTAIQAHVLFCLGRPLHNSMEAWPIPQAWNANRPKAPCFSKGGALWPPEASPHDAIVQRSPLVKIQRARIMVCANNS